ncbi:MAG: amidohydrolase family protein [Rhodobacteraceae bacterium]|nr:amidohydrolase family protein [Paracoccaceae bacterium]
MGRVNVHTTRNVTATGFGNGGAARLPGLAVPVDLLARPDGFGGVRQGDLLCGTLVLEAGRAQRLDPDSGAKPPRGIVLPRLAEAHVHLDKCHSITRIADVGGDLAAALRAQRADKVHWTAGDLDHRTRRGMRELRSAGCGAVRSHVDWATGPDAPEAPIAWDILGALAKAAAQDGIALQRAALTSIEDMAETDRARQVARRVARDGAVLGSFLFDQAQRHKGVLTLFRLADRLGLPLDFHVDEGLDPALNGLEIIADVALETGFQGPVFCSHACSLASQQADTVARVAEKLAKASIALAVLPSTNLYLQGRRAGTPDRRGLTRLHELAAHGVNIVIGTDNVRDAFYPIGRHDPLHSLSLAVMAGHLDPPFGRHLRTITTTARRAMGLAPLWIDDAASQDLIFFETPGLSDLIAGAARAVPLSEYQKGTPWLIMPRPL